MRRSSPKFKKALVYSVLFHVVLFTVVFVRFALMPQKPSKQLALPTQPKPIEAVAIQEADLNAEIKRLENIEAEKQRKQKAEEDRILAEKKKLEQQRKAEEQRLAKLKKEQEEAKRKLAEERKKIEAEKKKAEAEKQTRLAEEKKRLENEAQEAQAKAEKARLEKIAQEKREREDRLARQLAEEEAQINAQIEQERLREIDYYKAMVSQQIMRYWSIQGSPNISDTTRLRVRVAPSGVVLDVQIEAASGNELLDRSAVAAVYKASPLPVPEKPDLFKSFRELRLTLRPDSIVSEG